VNPIDDGGAFSEGRRSVHMETVESEAIESVGYDPERRTLRVIYRNGRSYDYLDVGTDEYDHLMNAESSGAYMNQVIKPRYKYRKVRS
jgi:hypothetical protein